MIRMRALSAVGLALGAGFKYYPHKDKCRADRLILVMLRCLTC